MQASDSGVLRLIAVFKFFKALSLIAVGVAILKMGHQGNLGSQVEHAVAQLGLDPGRRHVAHFIQLATRTSPQRIKELGIVSFLYAGLFLTEGIGLWLLKRWAEWFTVFITSSLVPFEAYEIFHHPTWIKIVVLIINVAVVVYLIYRIRSESHRKAA